VRAANYMLYIPAGRVLGLEDSRIRCFDCFLLGKLLEKTMMMKYGIENINDHFMSFNTICDATQVILEAACADLS
jgi:hypothetical protein